MGFINGRFMFNQKNDRPTSNTNSARLMYDTCADFSGEKLFSCIREIRLNSITKTKVENFVDQSGRAIKVFEVMVSFYETGESYYILDALKIVLYSQ
jgi:hypothetical protein